MRRRRLRSSGSILISPWETSKCNTIKTSSLHFSLVLPCCLFFPSHTYFACFGGGGGARWIFKVSSVTNRFVLMYYQGERRAHPRYSIYVPGRRMGGAVGSPKHERGSIWKYLDYIKQLRLEDHLCLWRGFSIKMLWTHEYGISLVLVDHGEGPHVFTFLLWAFVFELWSKM